MGLFLKNDFFGQCNARNIMQNPTFSVDEEKGSDDWDEINSFFQAKVFSTVIPIVPICKQNI